jgi:selenide,water dikinase
MEQGSFPGGTKRNLASYGHQVRVREEGWLTLLADPQTSGGLLVSVDRIHREDFEREMKDHGFDLDPIGELTEKRTAGLLIDVI